MGSGIFQWLQSEIKARYSDGAALIEESKLHGNKKYTWLLAQLNERGACDLVEAFRIRRNAEANQREWERKQRLLEQLETRLQTEEMSAGVRAYVEERAIKMRHAIERKSKQP